jgi:hypothetical protein
MIKKLLTAINPFGGWGKVLNLVLITGLLAGLWFGIQYTIEAVKTNITHNHSDYKVQSWALEKSLNLNEQLADSLMTWQQLWKSDSINYNGQIKELQKVTYDVNQENKTLKYHIKVFHADSCSCFETTKNFFGKIVTKEIPCGGK